MQRKNSEEKKNKGKEELPSHRVSLQCGNAHRNSDLASVRPNNTAGQGHRSGLRLCPVTSLVMVQRNELGPASGLGFPEGSSSARPLPSRDLSFLQ